MSGSIDARRDRSALIDAWLRRQGGDSFELSEFCAGLGITKHRGNTLLVAMVKSGRVARVSVGNYVAVAS